MGEYTLNPKTVSLTLFDRLAALLSKQDKDYPGVRFDNEEPRWQGGYGIARDHDVPDFVKKDNDGWDYVAQSKDE